MVEEGFLRTDAEKEDEIGMLSSLKLISETLSTLDFGVSYYGKKGISTTQYYHDFPWRVEIDSTKPQMIGLKLYVELINDKEYRLQAKHDEVNVYDVENDEVVRKVYDVEIDKVIKVGERYEDRNIAFTLFLNGNYESYVADKFYFVINSLGGLAKSHKKKLEAKAVSKESNIVNVSITGPVPEMDKKFINRLMAMYIQQDLEKNMNKGLKTSNFLENRLAEVNDTLQIIQNELAQFRRTSPIVDVGAASIEYSKSLLELEGARSKESVKVQYYDNIRSTIDNNAGLTNVVAPSLLEINDPLLNGLLQELSTLQTQRATLRREVKPGHPQLESLDRKISTVRESLGESVNSGSKQAQIALQDVDQRIGRTQGRLSTLPKNEKELIHIQRRFAFYDNMHKYLSEKKQAADIAINVIESNKRTIDKAEMVGDGPIAPNRNLIFLIALILGAGIPAGLVMLIDFFNNKIVSAEDIEANTNIPILGFIAQGDKEIKVISPETSNSLLAESFRAVRVNLQYLNSSVNQRILGVTSSMQGEGKTFCAMNLSVVFAQSGKKTLLIDMDLRRPQVAARMGLNNNRGISTYLMGRNTLDEIIQATRIENLDIIASGPKYENPLDLIGNPRMGALINELKEEYDCIILDTPPLVLASDYLILMQYIDYNMYVVRHAHTDAESLTRINELYDSNKIRNLGLIVNDVLSTPSNGYGYGYGYGYGHDKKRKNPLKAKVKAGN